jgi:HlyD family secretion protein
VERLDVEPQRERDAVFYPVTLLVDNGEHLLLPGMTANVDIEVARTAEVLAVLEAALRFVPAAAAADGGRGTLWVLNAEGRLQPIPVTPGLSDGAHTEVRPRAGQRLDPGQLVVVGLAVPGAGEARGPSLSLGNRR